jgi:uncharacterized membrane protein YgaE (UPF0421/DUF939 family)
VGERLTQARGRVGLPQLARILQTAVAAVIAWELALQLPDHGRPFFAPISAVIALGATLGRRGRQALEMMTGVTLGIVLGAVLIELAGPGWWQIFVVTFAALAIGAAAGAPPIVRNQAASAGILVVALQVPGSNTALQRLVDAAIGGAIAILFARILFPVHPVELVRAQARALRSALAGSLDEVARALETRDRAAAERALERIDAIDEHALAQALMLARDVARSAPRRRPLRRRIETLGTLYRELEASVSEAHAVGSGALRLLGGDEAPAPRAAAAVHAAAAAVRAIEPAEARAAADRAREAGRALENDGSLGAAVVGHAVVAIAEHMQREAEARETERRLAQAAPRLLR